VDGLAVATFALFQAGLLLRIVAEPLQAGGLLVLSAVSQWLAGVGFIANTWPRVKER
jgi:hypothetical protein